MPLEIILHKIRHSYAIELYKRSKNLRVVQKNLGHTSIKTTGIYLIPTSMSGGQVCRSISLSGTNDKA